jgi:hypothetical protein
VNSGWRSARDLHVTAEAADHQDLLEQLRRLRERVKVSAMDAARHEVIARAFRRRLDEDRRLDFEEVSGIEEVAHRLDQFVPYREIVL